MKLRNSIYVLLACASLSGLSSCAETDDFARDHDRVAVTFTPQIEGQQTRAVDQTWSQDDQVGIAMVASGEALPANTTFSQYVVSGAGSTGVGLSPVTVDQTLFYPTNGSDVNFVAFSPYATVASNKVTYSTFAKQSAQADMEKVDFLYHKGAIAYNKTSSSAALEFSHKLSKIIIKVTTSDDATAITLSSLNIQITGTPGSVTASLADGSITPGAVENIIPFHTNPDADTRVATAILVPHAAIAGRTITLAAQEGNFMYTFPSDYAFEGGKEYTLEFNVTHQGVKLTGSTIDNWTDGSVDWEHDYTLEVPDEMNFSMIGNAPASFVFKSNYSGTLNVLLSTDAGDPAAGVPDWIITDNPLTSDDETKYTEYTYSFTVTDNLSGSDRAAYAHIVDAGSNSLAVVKLNQKGLPIVLAAASNSYILAPGNTIFIPVSRANEHASGAIGATDAFTVELLWADAPELLATLGVIGKGSDGSIMVTAAADGIAGNALIAVKVGGVIKWSWHIWVTDYAPDPAQNKGWMDRNLGATSNSRSTVGSERAKAYGLYYQWGRKDPFPGSPSSSATEPTLYNGAGESFTYGMSTSSLSGLGYTTRVTNQQTIAWTVANPLTFISYSSGSWMTSSGASDTNWNKTNAKTIYDPCPSGYRVPVSGSWGTVGTDWSAFTWDASYLGRDTGSTYGGWFPASGRRLDETGSLNVVGVGGFYWSASPYSVTAGHNLYFNNTSVIPANDYPRSYGFTVRCCQD